MDTIEQLQFDHLGGASAHAEAPARHRRVMVVAAHELDARGLDLTLCDLGWTTHTCASSDADRLSDEARAFRPGIILYDVGGGPTSGSGIDLVRALVGPDVTVVILTSERRRLVLAEYLAAGAAGWIPRSAGIDEIDARLQDVSSGTPLLGRQVRSSILQDLRNDRHRRERLRDLFEQLSDREASVLVALGDGLNASEIAKEHFVGLATVRSQIRAVLQKLGVNSQLAAVAIATEHRHLLPQRGEGARERRRMPVPPSDSPDDTPARAASIA